MKALTIIALSVWAFAAGAQSYKVDPAHTSIVFKVNHMGFAPVYGMIGGAEGQFNFDAKNPAKSNFEVSAKVTTLTTLEKKRDDHLKGPDFFNSKQFPAISIKSTSVKPKGPNEFEVTADLTLHGVKKPVSFTFKRMKTGKDPWGNMRTGGETSFKIKRTDYGMTFMSGPDAVGDEVELMIGIEGIQK